MNIAQNNINKENLELKKNSLQCNELNDSNEVEIG
jgi:hypothetical protein